jgi:Amt family ammonium transporter
MDAAGASVLHVTGGLMAAAGAFFVGPRNNKYNTDGSSNLIPGHSTPLAATGLALVFVGWLPYVIGACLIHGTLPHAQSPTRSAINVILAAAASILVTYGMSRARYGKPDVHLTLGGLLSGLVSITACAGAVNPIAAVAIGGIGGMLVAWLSVQIDMNWKIDDPSGTIAAHIIGGAWSTLAAGIFAETTTTAMRLKQIAVQCVGLLTIALFASLCAIALFWILKSVMPLRVPEADEYDGLDLAEHDLNAYPDFQQTMIKSYHLREA